MKTTDLFKTSAKKLNESLAKTFGEKLNLESFDTPELEDARNKLRTQIHTARTEGGFNENIENEALSKAQFMHDAIVAEIMDRAEHIVDTTVEEAPADVYEMEYMFTGDDGEEGYGTITYEVVDGQVDPSSLRGYCEGDGNNKLNDDWCTEMVQPGGYEHEEALAAAQEDYAEQSGSQGTEGIETEAGYGNRDSYQRDYDSSRTGFGKRGREDDEYHNGGDYDPEFEKNKKETYSYNVKVNGEVVNDKPFFGRSAALAWAKEQVAAGKLDPKSAVLSPVHGESIEATESIEQTGDDMRNLREGEIQQASAIVTAKTMVDRVGRWIEELSGMENDTLLTLGDSIRDEMGQESAKQFISSVAPVIQSALENLKQARETLSGSVRALTGEEQPAEMLGAEAPDMGAEEMGGEAEPDAMNPDMGDEVAGDDFGAADAAAGGDEEMGRMKRESIDRSSRLLKVLAG